MVHVARLARENLRRGHALVLGLVGQHRPGDHVADGIDAGHAGLEVRVDHDALPVVELDARGFKSETFGVGHAPDRYQHHVRIDRRDRAVAGRRLDRDLVACPVPGNACHLAGELEAHALLHEKALDGAGHIGIHAGQDAVEKLDHQHFRSQPAPHGAQLQPDYAGADHQHALGHLGQCQGSGRRHDGLFVDLDAGQLRDIRSGGDDDALGVQLLPFAVFEHHPDLAGRHDGRRTMDGIDLVLLEQESDAVDVAFHALILEGQHLGQIELRRGHLDAHG